MAINRFVATPTHNFGRSAPVFVVDYGGGKYYKGTPGSSYLPLGAGCPEWMAAGGAVTHVGADKQCKQVQGIRIVIGDTRESIMSGFELVNFNFHCRGTQPAVASQFSLNGPIAV